MSKLEYNITTKKLTLINHGKIIGTWTANSGPYGKGAIPRGVFTVGHPNGYKLRSELPKGFQMPSGMGFFIPVYGTPKRTSIGIHPDGGKPGTHGCIGIVHNALGFWEKYKKFLPTRIHVK